MSMRRRRMGVGVVAGGLDVVHSDSSPVILPWVIVIRSPPSSSRDTSSSSIDIAVDNDVSDRREIAVRANAARAAA
eukprot:scaffold18565_cov73-Skeletonema_marinoi.AAC.1